MCFGIKNTFFRIMDKTIIDHILNYKKFDIAEYIKNQDIQNKESFDEAFKETLVGLYLNKMRDPRVHEWIRTQIVNDSK